MIDVLLLGQVINSALQTIEQLTFKTFIIYLYFLLEVWKDTLLSIELRCAQVITPQSLTTLLKSAALKKFIMERVYKK